MITNTSQVTASIVGTLPLVNLPVLGAEITLDEKRAPYISAKLDLAPLSPTVRDQLDPRNNVRVLITYDDEIDDEGTVTSLTRTFDLYLHERTVQASTGATVVLTLVSDEAKLIDTGASTVAHNAELVTAGASLRAVINRVLGEYGTALESGAADADFSPLFDASNDCINPGLEVNATGWSIASGGASGVRSTASFHSGVASFAATATGGVAMGVNVGARMPAPRSRNRRVALWFRTPGTGRQVDLYARILNAAGVSQGLELIAGPMTSSTSWQKIEGAWSFGWPEDWSYQLYFITATNATNQIHYIDDLFDGPELVVDGTLHGLPGLGDDVLLPLTPFGAGYGEPAGYVYSWEGATGASRYLRTRDVKRDPSALQRQLGTMDWDHLDPFVRSSGLRLYADEQRRWYLVEDPRTVAGTIELKEARLIDGDEKISLRGDYYDVVVLRYNSVVQGFLPNGTPVGTQIISQVDYADAGLGGTNLYFDEFDLPYIGPGLAAAILERSLARGRDLRATAVSIISTTPGMAVDADLPAVGEIAGVVAAVTLVWSSESDTSDRMTVRMRDVEDV